MSEVIRRERLARKEHTCDRCGQIIPPGTRYSSWKIPPGGELGYQAWITGARHLDDYSCLAWSGAL